MNYAWLKLNSVYEKQMGIRYTVFRTNYRCPHCGETFDWTAESTGPFNSGSRSHSFRYYIDSPLRICKKCHFTFKDSRVNEYITLDSNERDKYFDAYRSKGPVVWIIILSIYSAILAISAIFYKQPLPFVAALVLCAFMIIPISVRNKRKRTIEYHLFDSTIRESLNRCKNKGYLLALLDSGYKLYPLSDKEVLYNPEFRELNSYIKSINRAEDKNDSIEK